MTAKTTAGPCTWPGLKLRGTTEAFAFRLLGAHVTKTTARCLVIASFVYGPTVRDAEAALAGPLARSVVPQVPTAGLAYRKADATEQPDLEQPRTQPQDS